MLRSSIVAVALLGLSGNALASLENCGSVQYDPTQVSEIFQHEPFCISLAGMLWYAPPRFVSQNVVILDRTTFDYDSTIPDCTSC